MPTRHVPPARDERPPPSRLAMAALVVAAIPLCPFVSLFGALMGMVALRRIHRSAGRMGGRRTAQVAVILGWTLAALWSGLWWWAGAAVERNVQATIVERVEAALRARSQPEIEAISRGWSVAAEELESFQRKVTDRYGELDRVSVTSMTSSGTLTQTTYHAALLLVFEQAEQFATARFQMSAGSLQLRLSRLAIVDPIRGDLALPAES